MNIGDNVDRTMINKQGINELHERQYRIREAATAFFSECLALQVAGGEYSDIWGDLLTAELRAKGDELRAAVTYLSVDIAGAARGTPLIAEADLQDLRHNTKRMLASLHFHRYRYGGVYVHHDEDIVLGVDPPWQREESVSDVAKAHSAFNAASDAVRNLIDLLLPSDAIAGSSGGTATYRPNTAFIMMAIDKKQPDLEDVRQAFKEVCSEFGITAVTADEIEHDGAITDRILEEIETSEFLIADLTGEKPNVYYEVGHAHARDKRVILYRKEGTRIHFDIAHRNCPSYTNITSLKEQLRKRLEMSTNKPRKK